jgi:DNA-binding NtrC family response regulator
VNCAAVPETLFESELFGHARGAFTGATEARRGKFQLADGGTLFLDEVGEIPLPLQPKLLRALESGEVERVGGKGAERADVRVVAATNRDLEALVAKGEFRQDLYYRLLVVPIRVPALRERCSDIPLLAAHYLDLACRQNRVRAKRLAGDALPVLERHSWPGNVRELRNAMGRVAILVREDVVTAAHLAFLGARADAGAMRADAGLPLAAEMERHEREVVQAVLERAGWKMTRAAELLGLERSHLYKKLKALGIERADDAEGS